MDQVGLFGWPEASLSTRQSSRLGLTVSLFAEPVSSRATHLVLCTGVPEFRRSSGVFCLPEPKFAVFFSQLRLESQNDFDSLNLLKVR